MESTITRLQDEIARLQEENRILKTQLKSVRDMRFANLEAHINNGDYPGINIDMTMPDGDIVPIFYIEYYEDDGKWHVSVYSDTKDEPVTIFPLEIDLRNSYVRAKNRLTEIEDEKHCLDSFVGSLKDIFEEDE